MCLKRLNMVQTVRGADRITTVRQIAAKLCYRIVSYHMVSVAGATAVQTL